MHPSILKQLDLLRQCSSFHLLESSETLLIDLIHDHDEYLWRSLVIASAIRTFTGCKLIGIVGLAGVMLKGAVNAEDNRVLAKSFGVDDIIIIPEFFEPQCINPVLSRIRAIAYHPDNIRELTTASRFELSSIQFDCGFPIGKIVYETAMRAERSAIIPGGKLLDYWAAHVMAFDEWICEILTKHKISAFVTGHVDYCPWGHLATRVAVFGGRTVYYRCDSRVPINLIDQLADGDTLNGSIRHAETTAFRNFEAKVDTDSDIHNAIHQLAMNRFDAINAGLSRNWRWTREFNDDPAIPDTGDKRPVYVLFAHTFTDQPLADKSLFVDHADWIHSTLTRARQQTSYRLIVKLHPLDKQYDASGFSDRLIDEFRDAEHIYITKTQIQPVTLASSCAAGITVRGTPGIEMTALGLPMIVAGDGPYSDLGICLKPTTKEEYFDLLSRGPPFEIDIGLQQNRAKMFLAYDRFWSAAHSSLIPPFQIRLPGELDKILEQLIQLTVMEVDQLTLSLKKSWTTKNIKVVPAELDHLLSSFCNNKDSRQNK